MPKPKPSPQDTMLSMITGYWISQLLFVATELGIADLLAKGPLTAAAIARKVKADAGNVYRVLRALASVGVFAEGAGGRFRLTPLAQTLRSDRPGSMRDFARMMVDEYNWIPWSALGHGVRTGELPFVHKLGKPIFPYLKEHPEQDRIFSAAMASLSTSQNPAVAAAYPFAEFEFLVDVGGAHGHLLAEILRKHRTLRGVLYDQAQVVAGAAASGFVSDKRVSARCRIEGGSFFDSVPAGADGYIMKYIMHDWNDEECSRILGHCRDAMTAKGRVLIVETVIPPGNGENWGKLLDINMLVLTGGRERTREQFRDLLRGAGLRLKRVIPTASPLSIIEGVRG